MSRSVSGLILASFSLLNSSASISVEENMLNTNTQIAILTGIHIWNSLLTMMRSYALTSSRKSQCFSHCQFGYVQIILANVCRCSLWNKLIHLMTVVCHSSWYLFSKVRDVHGFFFIATTYGILTRNSWLSCPANAKSNVVFPELGGPKSNVILRNKIDFSNENR